MHVHIPLPNAGNLRQNDPGAGAVAFVRFSSRNIAESVQQRMDMQEQEWINGERFKPAVNFAHRNLM
jgi:hypothetical protein